MGLSLLKIYKKYINIFFKELASILPQNFKHNYAIDLEES